MFQHAKAGFHITEIGADTLSERFLRCFPLRNPNAALVGRQKGLRPIMDGSVPLIQGKRIALSQVPNALRDNGYEPAPYSRVWRAVVDGQINAVKGRKSWEVLDDLQTVAETLGLSKR